MKNIPIRLMLIILFLSLLFAPTVFAEETTTNAGKDVRILFTHDLHSSILPYDSLDSEGKRTSAGGFARLTTLIDQNKSKCSVLVDGGDFSMGSFFNSIFTTHSPELDLMGQMGYDATTIGNHEFDFGIDSLTKSLTVASKSKVHPTILNSNMNYSDDESGKALQAAMEQYGALKTKIVVKDGVKFGIFGMMSEKAQDCTSTNDSVSFEDTTKVAKDSVAELQKQGADVIICLSHGGTNLDPKQSEDQLLAKAVPEIDVIISGHTHTTLDEPITEGTTTIVSCGWRGKYLGVLDLNLKDDGSTTVKKYELKETSNSVAQEPQISKAIEAYKTIVQNDYLTPLGKKFDTIIGTADHNFTDPDTVQTTFGNFDTADLITDAYCYEAKKNNVDATIGIINAGLIRDNLFKGDVTESNVFSILNLGQSDDGSIGYPLTDFYLYGNEVKTMCQVDISLFPLMPEIQIFYTGLRYNYNDSRLPMDKIVSVEVQDKNGKWTALDDQQLYHITCSKYMVDMVNLVSKLSKGLVTITPRDSKGNIVSDTSTLIMKDAKGNEIKEWIALSDYIQSFAKDNKGVSIIPDNYQKAVISKASVTNTPQTFFQNPSIYALVVYGVCVGLILLIILVIVIIRHKRHKRMNGLNAKL